MISKLSEANSNAINRSKQDSFLSISARSSQTALAVQQLSQKLQTSLVSQGYITSAEGTTSQSVEQQSAGLTNSSLSNAVQALVQSGIVEGGSGGGLLSNSSSINSSNSITEIITATSGTDSVTYASSDPIQPTAAAAIDNDNLVIATTTSEGDVQKYTFNINDLYSTSPTVDFSMATYKDLSTGNDINPLSVLAVLSSGEIVQQTSTEAENVAVASYRLVTPDMIKQNTRQEPNGFFDMSAVNFSDKVLGNSEFYPADITGDTNAYAQVVYRYLFGFDNIVAARQSISNVAGYVSAPINVSDCSYIELSVDQTAYIEYSIIDGTDETPILPKGQTSIIDEKLFFGLMPRFDIADSSSILVKKNGLTTGISSISDLELLLQVNNTGDSENQSSFLQENTYTISYTPSTTAQVYYPKSDTIKVKVIQRYLNEQAPLAITNIVLHKYGIQQKWDLRSPELEE